MSARPLPAGVGADIPWTSHEAEDMQTNGSLIGLGYAPHTIETESSYQGAVRLNGAGDYVEFSAEVVGNAMIVRYSLPDAPAGGGTTSTLRLSVNGATVRTIELSSRNAWLYGVYPFSNDPAQGKPRNFYDEVQIRDLSIAAGDTVRLAKSTDDGLSCTLDFVDLETVAAPLSAPDHALDVRTVGARGDGESDDTAAMRRGIAKAQSTGQPLWVPPGSYLITGDLIVPSGVTIQGAGMWHTTFVGDPELYPQADRRVRFKLQGDDMTLADFAIFGALNYRNDQEANDGIIGSVCRNATIARIWIEHTKVGAWIYNGTDLIITGCRFRNMLADGVNLCVATTGSVVENCTARGTGDDCFAIWPAPSDQGYVDEHIVPGHNIIRHCTGQLTFLANGAAIYGGANNRLENCLFTDIGTGCGILLSTTFPTTDEDRGINNNFSGTTLVRDNVLLRCGGYDHGWAWRGAMQLCLHHRNISGLVIERTTIEDSFSDGLTIVAPGTEQGYGTLSDTRIVELTVNGVGLGTEKSHALFVREDARGELTLVDSDLPSERNASSGFKVEQR
ncbi:glycosyl hydrolase family 28-related protein [Synoicihabitans lomoniglobus]|uniref:Glycosyl hydrolase family 28-related protein n=2 Tax=Synoicihabitans lomoniglobus TaxID=2909285 RepID=A0AAE9ZSW8_9BACT|nr:glycosyl hydrolase family 28-related protein [Opitutaceae bacterium LMO-M01]